MDDKSIKDNNLYVFGPFRLDAAERRLTCAGEFVPLQAKALDLLQILVADAGHLKTREELIAALWPRRVIEEQGLTQRLHALRQALGDDREQPVYIETVRSVGYRFIAPVTIEAGEPATAPESARPFGRHRRLWIPAAAGLLAAIVTVAILAGMGILFPGARSPSARSPSIAVLPFENLSADKRNAYFAAGVQDEILTGLAKIKGLEVISRTSTERYRSRPPDLRTVARDLDVSTVLEGSVQRAGDEVHINVQLIDTRTLAHIWAQSYDRKLTDVFEVEGEVAARIATELKAKLLPAESARLRRIPTRDPQAYLLFLKANYISFQTFGSNNTKQPTTDIKRAAALYREAIAGDPEFAAAYARLSLLESNNYWFYDHSPQVVQDAEQAAKQALKIAPDLPRAHIAMGYVEYYGKRNYAAALLQFKLAQQALPNDADVIAAIGYIHRRQGKWAAALAAFRRLHELDPRNPRRYYVVGTTLAALRNYDQADQQFRRALALDPDDYVAMTYRVWVLLKAGRIKRARAALARIPDNTGQRDFVRALRFEAAWLNRDPDRALRVLAQAPPWNTGAILPYGVPVSLLRARAWLLKGNADRARQAYRKARAQLQDDLRRRPDFPAHWSALGLSEAGLGNAARALGDGKRATQLLPVSKDAFSGPACLVVLAMIEARTGKPDQALALLSRLLAMPAGTVISAPLLRLDPSWDPLRKNPRFQALLKQYDEKAAASGGANPPR